MPNDAKIGLVLGVGLVIAVAVVFFRKDAPADASAGEAAPAGIVRPIPPAPLPSDSARPTAAHPTGRSVEPAGPRRHTVREGDTLFSLARDYYGGAEKFDLIYRANRGVLSQPDPLPVGVELVIPEPPASNPNP
jgi:nucleoid-associated protein YgaU